jgi:hypothetical protein
MLILLITHIVIALGGLIIAAASLFTLSQRMIMASYALTVGTLATGTVLVFMTGNLLKSCLSGLLYLSAVLVITAITKYRLAAQKVDQ